jgi:hypothetical protein
MSFASAENKSACPGKISGNLGNFSIATGNKYDGAGKISGIAGNISGLAGRFSGLTGKVSCSFRNIFNCPGRLSIMV